MSVNEESKNESILRSGFSRKRSYQNIRESISGSLKKIGKKQKLDDTVGCQSSDSTFKYGNYNRYYGYRNEHKQEDKRLKVLKKEWFENKSVLDIGSNIGHVSLWVGKNFGPEKVKGVDIDVELVKVAKKNIVHYIDENYVSNLEASFSNDNNDDKNDTLKTNNSNNEEVNGDDSSDSENLPPMEETLKKVEETEAKELMPNIEKGKRKEVLMSIEEKCEVVSTEENIIPLEEKAIPSEDNLNPLDENVTPIEEKTISSDENPEGKSIPDTEEKEIEVLDKNEGLDMTEKSVADDLKGKQLMDRLDKNKNAKKENLFPYNISFILENYVPAGNQILKYIKEEFHVILCLSVTKWVQLNFGDFGLKLMFKKIYKQLYPGGMLILEPQPYKSYKRYKNLTPEIRRNYDSMKLMPDQFIELLLSNEVGFSKSEQIDVTVHEKQGFQRPIYLLTKE